MHASCEIYRDFEIRIMVIVLCENCGFNRGDRDETSRLEIRQFRGIPCPCPTKTCEKSVIPNGYVGTPRRALLAYYIKYTDALDALGCVL